MSRSIEKSGILGRDGRTMVGIGSASLGSGGSSMSRSMLNSGIRGSDGMTTVGIGKAIRGIANEQLKGRHEPEPSTGASGLVSGPTTCG